MKHVNAVTATLDPQRALAQIPVAQPIKVDERTAEIVNTVFTKLQGIFPAWRQAWPDDAALYSAKREWIAGFIHGGISSDQQLAQGFRNARQSSSPFMPNVGQFIAWCKVSPEDLGLPPVDRAWHEALLGKYSHDAVRIAAEATGTFDLREAKATDKALYQRFERNYAIVQRRAENAQPLDGKIAKGIEHDSGMKAQLARSHQEARDLIAAQNIPTDPQAARALLLARVGIRRTA